MSLRKMIAVAVCVVTAALSSYAVNNPTFAVSGGVDIVSAGSNAPSATTVTLETRYRTTDFSNFINLITEKLKGLFIIVK